MNNFFCVPLNPFSIDFVPPELVTSSALLSVAVYKISRILSDFLVNSYPKVRVDNERSFFRVVNAGT